MIHIVFEKVVRFNVFKHDLIQYIMSKMRIYDDTAMAYFLLLVLNPTCQKNVQVMLLPNPIIFSK